MNNLHIDSSMNLKKNIHLKYSPILFVVPDKYEIYINIMYRILWSASNNNVYITLFLIITYNNCRIAICHEVKQSQTWGVYNFLFISLK